METPGCGCPPTTTAVTLGRVHHLIVNTNDLAAATAFYDWLLPRIGYGAHRVEFPDGRGWAGAGGSFWVKQAASRHAGDRFDKDRVGLCEIAFAAASRADVDQLAGELARRGATILDAPREYAYVPGYYAVFFTDPDGMKLEYVHIPES